VKRLCGIVVATITPMRRTGAVDLGALKALVDFLVRAGVHGLFLLASQGEFYSLDLEERRRVAQAGVRAARGRVPVVVNAGTVSTRPPSPFPGRRSTRALMPWARSHHST
jgi:4-hydroxy-tetrahydrodipicolinate synthase